jgi:hypothetical protein
LTDYDFSTPIPIIGGPKTQPGIELRAVVMPSTTAPLGMLKSKIFIDFVVIEPEPNRPQKAIIAQHYPAQTQCVCVRMMCVFDVLLVDVWLCAVLCDPSL